MNNVIALMVEAILWGFYFLLTFLSIYMMRKKGIRGSRPRCFLLGAIISMFTLSTALLALDLFLFMVAVRAVNLEETKAGQSLQDKEDTIFSTVDAVLTSIDVIFSLEFLLGDAVIIWRTWALWQEHRFAMVLPSLAWAVALASLLAYSGYAISALTNLTEALWISACALSIIVGVICTLMIWYKAWQHRRLIRESFGTMARSTMVERVLNFLVESGLVYIILRGSELILVHTNGDILDHYTPTGLIISTSIYASDQIVGIYPTMIVVVVELQRTVWDSNIPGTSIFVGSNAINFALRTNATDVEASIENQHER